MFLKVKFYAFIKKKKVYNPIPPSTVVYLTRFCHANQHKKQTHTCVPTQFMHFIDQPDKLLYFISHKYFILYEQYAIFLPNILNVFLIIYQYTYIFHDTNHLNLAMKTAHDSACQRPCTHYFVIFSGLLILLTVPATIYLTNWQWSPEQIHHGWAKFFYFCSKSTHPIAGFIVLLLIILKLKPNPKQAILIFLLIAIATISGAAIKSAIKNYRQEPRPYVTWLQTENYIDNSTQFYTLPNKNAFVRSLDLNAHPLPEWLQSYWATNTGYTFPSGHTLFAAELALFMLLFLWPYRSYGLIAITMGWALLVEGSRIYLSMHWPIDIAASCLIAFILILISSYINNKWILKNCANIKKTD